jgi:hypothetical protein
MRSILAGAVAAFLIAPPRGDVTLDFSQSKLPDGWSVSSKAWSVKDGALVGLGDGSLDFAGPIGGDFTLTFKASSAEKTNFEVKLFDAGSGEELYTFAFLGRYHSVLDAVCCCLLKGGNFVAVNKRMWIYPGREFSFEVRVAKGQYQMFLDGELGPLFVDPSPAAPAKGMRLKILAATEGSKDRVQLDDVKVALPAPKK